MSTINKQSANQSQKLMVFVLTMALYGLATLFTELIPKFRLESWNSLLSTSCSSR